MVVSVPFLEPRIPEDKDFLLLKEMVLERENWTFDYDKAGIKIWSRVSQHASIKMVKVWSNFPTVSSRNLYNTILDPNYRPHWDPHLQLGCQIGYLNYNSVISYYAVSCPPPLRTRDFVLQTSWLDNGSELFVINHSVCHKDYPPKKGFIRGISFFTGYLIKCTNPQGIVPAWIVNKCTQIFAPRFVKQLEKAAFGYQEWKSQNNPTLYPWLFPKQRQLPVISLADCRPSHEEQESSFFKDLANANIKLDWWSREPQVRFAPTKKCSSELLVSNGQENKISTITDRASNDVHSAPHTVKLPKEVSKKSGSKHT
ncbi:hypothetical protein RUM43_009726 [Polyplax serrata]|uniref:START domain-containing protein n=1 Tax=Polyplax serrata TaxID=468196 RepID=A0AAN8P6J5_POLSC